MTDPREIEIKLEVEAADLADLKRRVLPNLGAGGASVELLSTYYDTPDQVLREHGLALRLRRSGGRTVQTLKAAQGAGAGLFDRAEWEAEVAGDELDHAALARTPARRLLAGTAPAAPVFEARITRTVWLAEVGRSRIELALDEGRVTASGRAEDVAELELELKSGCAADLFDLLRELADVARLQVGVLTKSERGYRLLDGQARPDIADEGFKADPVALDHGMSATAAFQTIARSCLRQIRLNEPRVVAARAPEALHQARVGLRRLRSALSLFGPVVDDGELADLKDGLRSLSKIFGDARNLDVYLARSAEPEAHDHPEEPGVVAYLSAVRARRDAAYDRLTDRLQSREVQRLMLDLLLWIEGGRWLTEGDADRQAARDQPVGVFAAALLRRRRRRVKRKGRQLDTLGPHERHRVRIEAKKLRYAADFFSPLAVRKGERRRRKAFLAALEALQRHLGDLNDIATGHDLARELAAQAGPSRAWTPGPAFAAGHVDGAAEAGVEAMLHAARTAHRGVGKAQPFWRRWSSAT